MRVAIYARVSTERQEREQTIESQLSLLRTWAEAHGYELSNEHVYIDEGYSGSRLDRPGLDRLRDAATESTFQIVAVLSPDRLARKYAYQVLLLEELSRAGCQVVFIQHPISDDPNDQLLLQIQGAIAEYERALLGERFRRGKLQKAKSGQVVAGKAPYGYRYIRKQDGVPGHLVIEETEAEFVRMLYGWLIDEQMTIRQILKRLNFGPWYPRSGKRPWSPSVVHHILADPVYTGTAYASRYRYVPPKKPRAPRGPRTGENSCRQLKPRDEWIAIPVPAIIDEAMYMRAQAQLAHNAQLSYRHNTKYSYLLRCLLTCSTCGLAMFGVTYKATATQPERTYYKCHGHDCILSARDHACPRRVISAEALESAVWNHIRQLLGNPAQLLTQFEAFAHLAAEGTEQEQRQSRQLQAALDRLGRQESRLLDAYQAEVIRLDELSQRRQELALKRQGLLDQQRQQAQLQQQQHHAQQVLESLTAFCDHIRNRLDHLTFAEKQALLQLLIERVIVGEDTLEIRHVIPLQGDVTPVGQRPSFMELGTDGALHAQCLGAYSAG
jgi:site-specific DNA recombinase